jgi:hypothetical protein
VGTSYSLFRVDEPIRTPEDDPGEPLPFGPLATIAALIAAGRPTHASGAESLSIDLDGSGRPIVLDGDPVLAISIDRAAPWDLLPIVDALADRRDARDGAHVVERGGRLQATDFRPQERRDSAAEAWSLMSEA